MDRFLFFIVSQSLQMYHNSFRLKHITILLANVKSDEVQQLLQQNYDILHAYILVRPVVSRPSSFDGPSGQPWLVRVHPLQEG